MLCFSQLQYRTVFRFFVIAALVSGATGSAYADAKIQPGEWKMTMKTKIKGLGIPLPAIPVSFDSCITQTNPVAESPQMKKSGCKIVDPKIDGNLVTYTGRCVSGETITETYYKLTYKGSEMSGTFDQVRKTGGQSKSTATGTIQGSRVGACKN